VFIQKVWRGHRTRKVFIRKIGLRKYVKGMIIGFVKGWRLRHCIKCREIWMIKKNMKEFDRREYELKSVKGREYAVRRVKIR
jgi:hypothetical protein